MKPANRDKTGKFLPGASGNPSGRPKRTEAEAEALTHLYKLAPLAVSTIHTIMTSAKSPPAVRLKACELVLSRCVQSEQEAGAQKGTLMIVYDYGDTTR